MRRWIVGLMLLPAVAMAADPQLAGFVDDDPVVAGATYRYTATVVNNDVDAATNTRLRVTVPSGARFVSATPASQNCVATTATQIDCNLGTVGADGADVRTIVLTWRALGPGPTTIAASATLSADNDVNAGNNTLTQNTTVSEGGDLSLAVTATPDPVVGGANITYTLIAANAGPNASGNLVITNNLSPSVSFVSASGSGWTCSHASGVVTCRRAGSHAVGAPIPVVTLVGTVTATGGTVTDTATVAPDTAGSTADPDINNNTAVVSTVVTPGADVRIAGMSVTSATPASAGSDVTFRIQPRNAGPSTAVNTVVTHTLPAGWTFVSAGGPNWTCSATGLSVRCTRASLSTSDTDDISLVATAPDNTAVGTGASYSHSAVIASDTADAVAGNNSGSASVSVLPDGADLAIAKSKTPNPVALGSDLRSLITVTNRGPRPATGALRVVDRLSGETFVSASGTGWTCAASGLDVVCNHANSGGLAVNASLPALTLVTQATVAGTLGNVACTSGSVPAGSSATALPPLEGDANTANDCASASANSTTVRPDLAITKTTSTPTGGDKTVSTSEASATFTLVVSNVSATAQGATGVVITDTIPGAMFYSGTAGTTAISVPPTVSGGGASFGCAVSGSTVTCRQSGGVLAQGQSVTVPITVNRPFGDSASQTGGIFVNTATVSNTAEGDPVAGNNSASDTLTVAPIADVQMTGKTVLPAAVRAGENATYTLSFRNNGPSSANGVVVTDTFNFPAGDSGLTVVAINSSASGSTCSIAAGAVLNPAAPSFTCNIGTLRDGQAESITLVVRPNFLAPNLARSFGNTAQITTTSVENPAGGDNGNNSQTATLAVNPAAIDLLVNTSDVPDLAIVGAGTGDPVPYTQGATFLNYRVRVNSVGPSYGTAVRVTERMAPPANRQIRFVCDTTTAGGSTCNPVPLCSVSNVLSGLGSAIPAFTCDVPAGTATTGAGRGELASGQSKDIFLRFEVMNQPAARGDVFDIQSTVAANEPDTQASNDTEAETTTTRQRIDLRVTKSASVPTVQLRQPFNWLIQVVNNGPGDSLQTDLSDTLPAGSETTGPVTWTRSAPSGTASGSCTVSGRAVSCALGQLDANGTATVTVPVRFTSLPAGGVASNSATVDTDPLKTGSMDIPGGNNTGTASITVQQSSLAGTVFQDRDRSAGNGGVPQAAASEPRIAGVSLTLTGTDAYGNAVNQTTTTDASGNYLFSGLSPSDASGYTVTETQPAGHINGPVAPPSAGALAPTAGGRYSAGSGSSGNSSYSAIVLAANTAATQYHFPEVRQPGLSGFVYLDTNQNATRDAGSDTGIAGASVRLLNAATGAVVASTTTDASGAYAFSGLDPLIAYTLEQPLPASPANLQRSGVNPGLIGGAACASGCTAQPDMPSAGTDRIAAIDLSAGADGTLFNFGERVVPATQISGLVYLDANRDNALGGGEATRLAGVVIRLVQGADCASGSTLQTVTTGSDGAWRFDNVTVGQNYLVCQTQPAGYDNGNANGVAGSNQIAITNLGASGSSGNLFGETLATTAAIGGRVWLDVDNSGSADASERGIAGVTLHLGGTDSAGQSVSRSTTTDADGAYRFDNLPPGSYAVTQPDQPAGTADGQVRAGSTGGTATAKGSTPSSISAIALGTGQQSTANDFGEVPVGRIAGRVWADNNDDGVIDTGETGLAGVGLVLTGTDDLGRAVSITATTGADGSYAFEGLRPGRYTVTEPTQPAGTVDGRTVAGTLGGTASAAGTGATTPSAIAGIVLPPGGASLGNNFGEIGQSPDLRVTGSHSPATLTVGQTAVYTLTVRNAGELPSSGSYTVEDQLPPGLGLAATPTGTGWTCTGAVGASRFSCTSSAVIAAGATSPATIHVVASVGAAAVPASPVNNAVMVDGGGELDARRPTAAERSALAGDVSVLPLCAATPQANACRDPAPVQLPASLSGTVWLDQGAMSKLLDGGDRRLPGWLVEVVDAGGQVVARATTGSDGAYKVSNLVPGTDYAVRFRDPVSGVVFGPPVNGETAQGSSGVSCASSAPAAGVASSCVAGVTTATGPQLNVVLAAGQELTQQSLPVDPSGVVYDAGTRAPVAGAVVTLAPTGACAGWNPATQIVGATLGGYTVSGNAIAMTVGDNGAYQFLIGPSAPASCSFGLTVTPPSGYSFASQILPPASVTLTPSGAAGSTYAVLPSAAPPTGPAGAATTYYLAINTGSAGPNVVHNHIPLDPALPSGMSLSKTGDKAQAEVGDSLRYTITVQVAAGPRPRQTTVVDRLPAGFTYIRGTATVNDVAMADPVGGVGPTLAFHLGTIGASGQAVLKYRVRVGVGAQQGDGVNRARAYGCALPAGCVDASFAPVATAVATNEGRHAVRVGGGVFATEACVLGKVFVDCNGNHVQDREELGIPGVRLVTSDGSTLISDSEGKYSLCGLPPRSHVIKVDPATLPRGSRLTTSSNRNLGDAGSLWLDLKTGELHRADFIEGSCSNTVLEQVKARRAQGEVRAPEVEKKGGPALRFDSKAHGLNTQTSPQQGTDGANQRAPKTRTGAPGAEPLPARTETETNVPTPQLPMNRPPPDGRDTSQAPDAANATQAQANGGSNGTR